MEQPAPEQPPEQRSYEQLVQDLELCVRDLEEGRLPLEQAIGRFKQGVSLVKLAEQRLQAAEGQVNLLLKGEEADGGGFRKEPFAVPASSEAPQGARLTTSAPRLERPVPSGTRGDAAGLREAIAPPKATEATVGPAPAGPPLRLGNVAPFPADDDIPF